MGYRLASEPELAPSTAEPAGEEPVEQPSVYAEDLWGPCPAPLNWNKGHLKGLSSCCLRCFNREHGPMCIKKCVKKKKDAACQTCGDSCLDFMDMDLIEK